MSDQPREETKNQPAHAASGPGGEQDKAANQAAPNAADQGKTVSDPVRSAETAPKAGVEREDAQPSDSLNEVALAGDDTEAAAAVLEVRTGMWSRGTGDTSGYGGLQRVVARPQGSARPYGGWFDAVADRLSVLVPGAVSKVVVDRGEITLHIHRERLPETVKALRDDAHLRFEQCASVSGVHYPTDKGAELHSVYHLQSYTHNRRLRLEVSCSEEDPHIPSVVATYPMADWHERETWDMFGIIYDGHPALTRILMPDDWWGHPQRKDYPLGGIPVEYKGTVVPPPDQRRSYSA